MSRDKPEDSGILERPHSRREFLVGAGVLGTGIAAAMTGVSSASAASRAVRRALVSDAPPLHKGLASGMIGGPFGFKGAERYQYPANSAEGRAILAARALRKAGTAPDTIIVQSDSNSIGQYLKPSVPGGPTVQALWEKETGIKLKFFTLDPSAEYTTNLKNATTHNGSFDVVDLALDDVGTFASSGLLRPMDDLVAKYHPDWNDPKFGYSGAPTTTTLFNKFNGHYYAVSLDNDTQPWAYRSDLFNNPKEQDAFHKKYGYELAFPKTWEQYMQVAAFFTRPSQQLYGAVECLSSFWGVVNWQQRYACQAIPNAYLWNDDGSAAINSPEGVYATELHLQSLQYHEPGGTTKYWPDEYALLGDGHGVMGGTFPNVTKLIVPGNKQFDKGFGKYLRTAMPPGHNFSGKLIRRSANGFNVESGVNAFAPTSHQEVAYLFLQWLSGAHVFSWLVSSPAGLMDPNRPYAFEDPRVIKNYGVEETKIVEKLTRFTVPPFAINGGSEYQNALDINLQKVLAKSLTPKQAMKATADTWDQITKRLGRDKQTAAIRAQKAAYPTQIEKM